MQRLAMPCLESMGSGHPSVVQRLEYRKRVFLTIVLTAGLLALLAAAIPRVGAVPALAFVSPLAPVNNSRRLNGRQIDTACGWINKGEECCPWGQICPAGSECYSTGQMSTRRCRVAGQSCPSGQRFCSFVCTNLDTSMNNCGSCGHTCGGSSEADWYCSGGECKYSCKPPVCAPGQMVASAMAMCPYCRECGNGKYNCGPSGTNNCVDRTTDNQHVGCVRNCPDDTYVGHPLQCGSCGNACPSSSTCTNGVCRSTDPCAGINCGSYSSCSAGRCSCNSGYSSPSGDGRNCEPIDPCRGINCGDYSSCSGGKCTCNPGYESTTGDGKNCRGIDPCRGINCGDYSSCSGGKCTCNPGYESPSGDGKNCAPVNPCRGINCGDYSSCSGGKCTCNPGYESPSGDGKGCIVIDKCRGITCPSGQVCSNGGCVCSSGLTSCGGSCINLNSDSRNCGACATSCPDGQSCSSGRCVCPSGLTNCNGFCVSVDSDRNHCGRCENACAADSTGCSSGTCQFRPTCGSGQTNCGSETSLNCVVLDSDLKNCGACGSACPSGQICSSGRCGCPNGLTACGSACVSTNSDINHCGQCNSACGSGATGCVNGACQIPAAPSPSPPPPPASTTTTSSPPPPGTTRTSAAPATSSASTTSSSASTTTATLVFASPPTAAVAAPAGATPLSLSAGSRIFLTAGSRGLSCNPDCVLADGSSGEYAVAGVAGSSAIRLQRGSSCLQARQSGSSFSVVDWSCPASPARLQKRQAGSQLFPYWALFNSSSGSLMIMNANVDASSGCLQPSSGSSVSLGSCSTAAASQWTSPGSTPPAPSSSSSSNIGAIVGGVVGGVVALAAAGGIAYYVRRKQRAKGLEGAGDDAASSLDGSESDHAKPPKPAIGLASQDTLAFPTEAIKPAAPKPEGPEPAPQPAALSQPVVAPKSPTINAVDEVAAVAPPAAADRLSKDTKSTSDGSQKTATMSRTPIPSPTPTQNFAPVVGISGSGATNPDAAVPRQSSGSGAGAVAINISPSASKLLISKDDISIDRNQRLGEGGFGVVYVGTLRGSTKVAVKTIKGDLDDRTMAAFVKEVANWEGLVQRNVLPLMAFCVSPPMMVMDLIEEGNMRKYLGARGWDQALGRRFLHDVACGMAYLHASGILHGDLKSLNVLVDGLRAVITDFGLSRVRLEVSKSTARTGNGMQGTPGFVPPEMLTGGVLKPPGDVYAFAMLCYEVVSKGRYPFDDLTNIAAIVYKVAFERRRPVRPEGVPDAMWELMERAWAHEPLSRPDFVELEKETAKLM